MLVAGRVWLCVLAQVLMVGIVLCGLHLSLPSGGNRERLNYGVSMARPPKEFQAFSRKGPTE